MTAGAPLKPNAKIFLVFSMTLYILELAFPVIIGVMGNCYIVPLQLYLSNISTCFIICNELIVQKECWF